MSGRPHRRGTNKENATTKLQGRQCTFIYIKIGDEVNKRPVRRCKNKTGKNYFFCKQHHSQIVDYGMVGI